MDVKKKNNVFQIKSIGVINSNEEEGDFSLLIDEDIRPALKHLDDFNHVLVFWWADKMDNEKSRKILTADLPYAKGIKAGVFACRSEYRPNPIAMSICNIINIDEKKGIIQLDYIEAFDGTPIIDLKPYSPMIDKFK